MDPNAVGAISESLVEKMKTFLGEAGKTQFLAYHEQYGTVSPVFMTDRRIPHPVHFREGMQIRNFMRSLPECEGWTAHEFDNTWALVVAKAIGVPYERP
jgi:hypothetical protein